MSSQLGALVGAHGGLRLSLLGSDQLERSYKLRDRQAWSCVDLSTLIESSRISTSPQAKQISDSLVPLLTARRFPHKRAEFKLLVGKPLMEVEVRHDSDAAV